MSTIAAEIPKPRSNPWIVSQNFDLLLFSGSALVVLLPWMGLARYGDAAAGTVIALVAIFSNGPHLTATWTRAWLDSRERNERPIAYMAVPALIFAAVWYTGMSGRWGMRLLQSVLVAWATWHFAAQCYGLLRIYHKKSGEQPRIGHRYEAAFIFTAGATGLIWRLHYGPTRAFGYRVLLPDMPFWAVALCLVAMAALTVAIVVDRTRPDVPLAVPRLLFLASILVGFWVPFMMIEHGSIAFAAAAAWHGLQYLGVVWLFSVRKHGNKPLVDGARLVGWVSQPGRGWAFMVLLWAMAASVYIFVYAASATTTVSFGKAAALTWSGLTLGHYWLDGLIWKMRKPAVSAHLT